MDGDNEVCDGSIFITNKTYAYLNFLFTRTFQSHEKELFQYHRILEHTYPNDVENIGYVLSTIFGSRLYLNEAIRSEKIEIIFKSRKHLHNKVVLHCDTILCGSFRLVP